MAAPVTSWPRGSSTNMNSGSRAQLSMPPMLRPALAWLEKPALRSRWARVRESMLGRLPRTLVALQLGAFLNITVIFEPRSTALNVMTGVSAALQLTLVFLLIENLWEKRD